MDFLFRPVDIASLVFYRIAFGVLAAADALGIFIYYHLYSDHFNPDKFQFGYYGFEWVTVFPEPLMSLFFLLLISAAVCIGFGRFYRVATVVFFLGFTYAFLLEKAHYLNHGYFFCWLSFVMIFLPAHREASGDVLADPSLRRERIPFWCIALPAFLMGVVYFFGGIAKLNADWLSAVPLGRWIAYKKDLPLVGPVLALPITGYFMAYAGAFLDLFVVPLLLWKRTRLLAVLMLLFFHLTNTVIFQIGIFPWLSLAMTVLYFPPHLPRKWWRWMRSHTRFGRWIDRRYQRHWTRSVAAGDGNAVIN